MKKLAQLDRKKLISFISSTAIVLLLVSGWLWWQFVFTDPQNVFQGMLSNSLKTAAFSKNIRQDNSGQTLDQKVAIQSGAENVVQAITDLNQSGPSPASVTTESIGTLQDDFVRYTAVNTSQKTAEGKELDFSQILNVWGKSTISGPDQSSGGQLFRDNFLGIVPLAQLSPSNHHELLKFIKDNNLYKIDYGSVQRTKQSGRSVYIYKVEANAEKYIEMLKMFGRMTGLKDLENIDPTVYRRRPPVKLELSVDVLSRQLLKIKYTGTDREETYSSYGAITDIKIPTKVISVEELQSRLQSIQ